MLIGPGWAFAHIPKCGGTALRSVLHGFEAGRELPLDGQCPIDSHLHSMLIEPPPGRRTFTVVRHPADWIRSFWQDQSPQRMGGGRYLHRYWSDDPDTFAARLCAEHPGYVGQLYDAYTSRFEMRVYRLEQGLETIVLEEFGVRVKIPLVNAAAAAVQLAPRTLALIGESEAACLEQYGYP